MLPGSLLASNLRLGVRRKGLTGQWYDDENISSMASSGGWAVVTRPGQPGFWQRTHISVARLQMSRQRAASPERAATYKRQCFIPWDPCPLSPWEKPTGSVLMKRKGRGTLPVVQWHDFYLPDACRVSETSLVRELRSHIPQHGTEAGIVQIHKYLKRTGPEIKY